MLNALSAAVNAGSVRSHVSKSRRWCMPIHCYSLQFYKTQVLDPAVPVLLGLCCLASLGSR